MVNYARARAEGLSVECRVGLMQRTERIVLLIFGALLGSIPWIGSILMKIILVILAISSNCTAISRIVYLRRKV
jgi:CDP-diacylglycerol--glycerol-3-phosphate 3-phosphatidyltransferase